MYVVGYQPPIKPWNENTSIACSAATWLFYTLTLHKLDSVQVKCVCESVSKSSFKTAELEACWLDKDRTLPNSRGYTALFDIQTWISSPYKVCHADNHSSVARTCQVSLEC